MSIDLIPMETPPEVGKKIVAFYSDGSGARIFMVCDGEFWDADGDRVPNLGGMDRYAYLPDDFTMWAEDHVE